MHRSKFVLAPNGDRPECFGHSEALALGTVPITELDPALYRHLSSGLVVFNNTQWNLKELTRSVPAYNSTNRRMAFQEYWMEYADQVVGRRLQWRGSVTMMRRYLSNIQEDVE
jgi:hypothetical protein